MINYGLRMRNYCTRKTFRRIIQETERNIKKNGRQGWWDYFLEFLGIKVLFIKFFHP